MTETHPKITAGIDVGKAQLELSIGAGPTQTYANAPPSIAALTLELARQPEPIAPPGGVRTHRRLRAPTGDDAGLRPACPLAGCIPTRCAAYARACGQLAKTDRLDAKAFSCYAAAFDLSPDPSPETEDAAVRARLAAQRTPDKSRLDKGQSDEARASRSGTSPGWTRKLPAWKRPTGIC